MDKLQLIALIFGGVILLGGFAFLLLQRAGGGKPSEIRGLMSRDASGPAAKGGRPGKPDPFDLDLDTIKKQASKSGRSRQDDVSTKLFKAGFFTAADRRKFLQIRIISLCIATVVCPLAMWAVAHKPFLTIIGFVLGVFIGFTFPLSWLERQIRKREEDVLYYLPLVIEQISIGVSSALDVGPCISQIISMAEERDSHNVVTEMFVHVDKLMRSGLNLEDSLTEVAEANGMTEVKHAFMFLAQCAKHGGEVSRQLQELADAVTTQRQVQIEGKITALPVKATGPLAMVFAGFFALLFAGLLVNLLGAFGK